MTRRSRWISSKDCSKFLRTLGTSCWTVLSALDRAQLLPNVYNAAGLRRTSDALPFTPPANACSASVQNLGKYERQQWQVAEFPSNGENRLEEQKEREAAYRKFILELYHATPVSGHVWLHGVKAGRMVHVGAVDAPVTRADVNAIAAEVWKASGKGPTPRKNPPWMCWAGSSPSKLTKRRRK